MDEKELKEKLLDLKISLEGSADSLKEQAVRVEKLYGVPTPRSKGYWAEAHIKEKKIEEILEALKELEQGDFAKARKILGMA